MLQMIFLHQLEHMDLDEMQFQKDGATSHTAGETITLTCRDVCEVFNPRMVGGYWATRLVIKSLVTSFYDKPNPTDK